MATGRKVVMTGVNVVGNPDFEKLRLTDLQNMNTNCLPKQQNVSPGSDRIYELWQQGIRERFVDSGVSWA